jgi:hypothetical protein
VGSDNGPEQVLTVKVKENLVLRVNVKRKQASSCSAKQGERADGAGRGEETCLNKNDLVQFQTTAIFFQIVARVIAHRREALVVILTPREVVSTYGCGDGVQALLGGSALQQHGGFLCAGFHAHFGVGAALFDGAERHAGFLGKP